MIKQIFSVYDEDRSFFNCSYRYFARGECDQQIYDIMQDQPYSSFLDLYFHRTTFNYNDFSDEDKRILRLDWEFLFLAKSIFIQRQYDLISVGSVYNTHNTSLLTLTPSQNMSLSTIQYQDCMGKDFLEPYDPRCRGWYVNAMQNPGNNVYKPYMDAFSKQIIMTASSRIDDNQGNNLSVISIDFIIKNLIQNQFEAQDMRERSGGMESYSVLFHVENNTVYHHKNWDNSENILKSWQDLEFNSSMEYDPEEKSLFLQSIEESKAFSLQQNYSISEIRNIENFYQFWKRNNKELQNKIKSPQQVWNKTIVKQQVLMVGKVREDFSSIFHVLNLTHDKIYLIIVCAQTGVVLIFVVLSLLHFTAVLFYQVDIPLQQLTQFLIQNQNTSKSIYQVRGSLKKRTINSPDKSRYEITKSHQEESKSQILKLGDIKRSEKSNQKLFVSSNQWLLQNNSGNSMMVLKDSQVDKKPSFPRKVSNPRRQQNRLLTTLNTSNIREIDQINEINESQNQSCYLKKNYSTEYQSSPTRIPQLKSHSKKQSYATEQQDNFMQESSISKWSILTELTTADKINISTDLEPMFLEMKIITDAFHQLGDVITYKKNDIYQNQLLEHSKKKEQDENFDLPYIIFHYSFAVRIFKQLKNNFAQALGYINLGYYCQKKNEFEESLINYEIALQNVLMDLNFTSINDFLKELRNGTLKIKDIQNNQFEVICTSLILQAHIIKEIILDRRDLHQNCQIQVVFLKQTQKNKWLKRALNLIDNYNEIVQKLSLNQFNDKKREVSFLMEIEYIEMCLEISDDQTALIRYNQLEYSSSKIQDELIFKQYTSFTLSNQDDFLLDKENFIEQIIEAKKTYLQAVIHQKLKNFKYAAEGFTLCLENYSKLDNILIKKCLENLIRIFRLNSLQIFELVIPYSQISRIQTKIIYDIVILVEGSLGITLTFENEIKESLNYMYEQFIFKNDRVTFMVFQNNITRIIQPLVQVEKMKQWQFCLESIQTLSQQISNVVFSSNNNEISDINTNNNSQFVDDVFIGRNAQDASNKYKFIKLQQKSQNKNQNKQSTEQRKPLFFVFSNSNVDLINNDFNIQNIIQPLSQQFSSPPQIFHLELQQHLYFTNQSKILEQMQNKDRYILLQKIEQLTFVINCYRKQEKNYQYMTNVILSSSCL